MLTSLFAVEEREAKSSGIGDPLDSLNGHVDFEAVAILLSDQCPLLVLQTRLTTSVAPRFMYINK